MNNNKQYLPTFLLTIAIAAISSQLLLQHWNPYTLNGPRFLHFYITLLSIAYIGYLLSFVLRSKNIPAYTYFPAAFIWIATGGVIRLIQGIYNNRPVGFLVLLLIIHIAGYVLVRTINKRIAKS